MDKNMMKKDIEVLEFDKMLSRQRKRGTTMSVSPAISKENITSEEKRILKEMNKGVK